MWPDERVVQRVHENFIPVRVHVRDNADDFKRLGQQYGADWTPTTLMLDASGAEQHRIEGFLPVNEFLPHIDYGLGRIAFAEQQYDAAEKRFRGVVEQWPESEAAAQALYWAGVAQYKTRNDASALKQTALALKQKYPSTAWAKKASVWDRG